LKIFLSETTQPMELLHYRNDDWVVLCQVCYFFADRMVEDHPVIISIMLQFHRLSSFWQEDLQSFNQSDCIFGPGDFRPKGSCEVLPSLGVRRPSVVRRPSSVVRRPSVNFSYFNLLLWNINLSQVKHRVLNNFYEFLWQYYNEEYL
jgi:hypothetical protein